MRLLARGWFLAIAIVMASAPTGADERQEIQLPPQIRDQLLAEMRGHLANLDDLATALASGDFAAAAEIAEIRMSAGHRMLENMTAMGASPEQIEAMRQHRMQMMQQMGMGGMGMGGMGMGRMGMGGMGMGMGGMGMGMGGMGMGRFMPEEFRALGMGFHAAADEFAKTARAVSTPPTVADYQAVMSALGAVTTACRGCHDAFKVR